MEVRPQVQSQPQLQLQQRPHLRSSRFNLSDEVGVSIDWSIVVVMQQRTGFTNATIALNKISQILSVSIASGTFVSNLIQLAVDVFANVTSLPVQVSPKYIEVVLHFAYPTSRPTTQPSVFANNSHFIHPFKSDGPILAQFNYMFGLAAGICFLVPTVAWVS